MIAPGGIVGDARFEVGARLGHGEMGMVFRARDRKSSRQVALKVYRRDDDVTRARVQQIYERLRGLEHRNVVELVALFEEDGAPILVMERVDGEDMMAYCAGRWRSGPPDAHPQPVRCDVARLRACLIQLAAGLDELHRRDVIHRDLKPSNLRVTPEGRLVILDFSLSGARGADGLVGGSVPYMAPEQAMMDASVGPAADWYAVGAIAYEALAGRLPYLGEPQRVLRAKASEAPPSIEHLVTEAPRDLVELCRRLLVPDPRQRPTDGEIRALVGVTPPVRGVAEIPPRRQARAATQAVERLLSASVEGLAGLVVLSGERGMGRTSALAAVGEQLRTIWPHALFLSLPVETTIEGDFLDRLGAQLNAAWASLPPAEQLAIVPTHADTLVELLPALALAAPIEDPPELEAERGPSQLTDAIDALRELLTLLARRRPVVLLVDELDELDQDSRRVLADGLRGPDPPPVLLVGTCCDEARLPTIEGLVPVPMAWWARGEIERLIADRGLPEVMVRSVVERSDGRPGLALELARAWTNGEVAPDGGLEDVLAARITRLTPALREVLVAASVVSGGVPVGLLRRALDAGESELDARIAELATAGLVAVRGTSSRVAPANRAVRAALARTTADTTRGPIALALANHGEALPPAMLAQLRSLGGDERGAADAAARAGAVAAARLRFAAAADAYRVAVAGGRDQHLVAFAAATAAAGRGAEAASAFADASKRAAGAEQLRLAVRAAEHLILAGALDAGVAAYRHALGLAGVSLASSPARALPKLLLRRGWLRLRGVRYDRRPRTELTPFDLARADACLSAAFRLGPLETVIGAELQAGALAFALALGDPERLGCSAVLEAIYLVTQGAVDRSERLLGVAREISAELGDTGLTAFVELGAAARAFFHDNRFAAAMAGFDRVFSAARADPWTRDMAETYACISVAYLGDVHDLTRRVLRLVREAERRGDYYAAMVYRVRTNLVWLARGDLDGADAALADAAREWPFDAARYRVPDYYWFHGRVERALWAGDVAAAASLIQSGIRPLERSMLTRVNHVRAETDFLAGRVAIATAARATARRAVAPWTKRLRRNLVGSAPVLADLLDGCAAARDGETEAAISPLRGAIARADTLAMGLHAAAARTVLGELLGGQEGAASTERGRHELAQLGITAWERTVAMIAPR